MCNEDFTSCLALFNSVLTTLWLHNAATTHNAIIMCAIGCVTKGFYAQWQTVHTKYLCYGNCDFPNVMPHNVYWWLGHGVEVLCYKYVMLKCCKKNKIVACDTESVSWKLQYAR